MRQTSVLTDKKAQGQQQAGLLVHAAVRTHPSHAEATGMDSDLRTLARDYGYNFTNIPANAPTSGTRVNYATPACPVFPRRCPFGGACHACPVKVQAKLAINQPGDRYEQEADRIADQVVGMRAHSKAGSLPTGISRVTRQSGEETDIAPASVDRALAGSSGPLEPALRQDMERRFGYDFSKVRVHTSTVAEQSARDVNAHAYTLGHDIVFGASAFAPGTQIGRRLIAHELTHVVQQSGPDEIHLGQDNEKRGLPLFNPETEASHAATPSFMEGQTRRPVLMQRFIPVLQREESTATVRSPFFEEAVTQISTAEAAIHGRPLTRSEQQLAQSIFVNSIDYSRVRLIPTRVLEYRTVGNTIRIPRDFTIDNLFMRERFFHEMTHVWQYQHYGTSYISRSLFAQTGASATRGRRDYAYLYRLTPQTSFFDLSVEQQAYVVQNYFRMLRDQETSCSQLVPGCYSNHMRAINETERRAEISRELPDHRRLIQQMQRALPQPEVNLLQQRALDVMQQFQQVEPAQEERGILPVRPLFEVRF